MVTSSCAVAAIGAIWCLRGVVMAIVQLQVRLPEELRDKLNQAAQVGGRSMNAEIVERLSETFSERWQAFLRTLELRKEAERRILEQPENREAVNRIIQAT